jgi:hypothetical protein
LFGIVQKKRQIAAIVEKYQAKHGLGSVEEDKKIEKAISDLRIKQKQLDIETVKAINEEMAKIKDIQGKGNWYQKRKLT